MNYLVAPERHEREGFVLRSYEPGDGALLAAAQNASYDHLAVAGLGEATHQRGGSGSVRAPIPR